MSKGEERIADLLARSGFCFEREKTFSDLKGGKFRYDFYVTGKNGQKCLLEFNGEQHYRFISWFCKTKQDWQKIQEHDRRKISYALAKQIPIYIVPFWELPKITSADELFVEKYRARTRWKNDEDSKLMPRAHKS